MAERREVTAFNIGTRSKYDETSYADQVSRHLNIELKTRYVSSNEFTDYLGRWAYVNDDPVADPSALTLMMLSEFAENEGMKVMLSGEGADELFCGYKSYVRFLFARNVLGGYAMTPIRYLLSKTISEKAIDYIRQGRNIEFVGTAHATSHNVRHRLVGENNVKGIDDVMGEKSKSYKYCTPLQRASIFDQQVRLQNDLLMRTDRATMAYAIEGRVPFLDVQIGRIANSLPDKKRVKMFPKIRKKPVLKKIAATMVPSNVVYRKKRGFELPMREWLSDKKFGTMLKEFIFEGKIDKINYKFVSKMLYKGIDKQMISGIWAWVQLEVWYRMWVEAPRNPKITDVKVDSSIKRYLDV
jgi:asparagine synthase (glutamine-hydrolysing)